MIFLYSSQFALTFLYRKIGSWILTENYGQSHDERVTNRQVFVILLYITHFNL